MARCYLSARYRYNVLKERQDGCKRDKRLNLQAKRELLKKDL
jgi:hypothetical protein